MAKTNTKIVGKEHYINAATGELMEMDVIESIEKDVDANFYKLFMKDFFICYGYRKQPENKGGILDN